MFGLFPKKQYRDVEQLREPLRARLSKDRPINKRKSIEIAVIDDQNFAPLHSLRSNQFQITQLKDLSDIRDIERYVIVLCDLHGVGITLNASQQGAQLIREIKVNYPEKYVIAYTGSGNSPLFQEAFARSDLYLPKDARTDQWIESLDAAIEALTDPMVVWKKYRLRLLEQGITPYELAELEDAFVRKYEAGPDSARNSLIEKMAELELSADIRAVVNGLIASVIFKYLFNGGA
jgi:DNA-binding NarL/FixJ family response regulator